jgi:hypothetical protein
MLFIDQIPSAKTSSQYKMDLLSSQVLPKLPLLNTITLPANELCRDLDNSEQLFVLEAGTLVVNHASRPLLRFEAGDIVNLCALQDNQLSYDCVSDIKLRCYSLNTAVQDLNLNEISKLFRQFSSLLVEAIDYRQQRIANIDKGFLQFQAGDIIIEQHEEANYVYSLLDGHAKVYQNDVIVGEVLKDEIFGALAVFTNSPRNASVIACSPCTVLAVPKEQFVLLIQARPDLCQNLFEHMARKINALNDNLSRFSEGLT